MEWPIVKRRGPNIAQKGISDQMSCSLFFVVFLFLVRRELFSLETNGHTIHGKINFPMINADCKLRQLSETPSRIAYRLIDIIISSANISPFLGVYTTNPTERRVTIGALNQTTQSWVWVQYS